MDVTIDLSLDENMVSSIKYLMKAFDIPNPKSEHSVFSSFSQIYHVLL